MLYSSKRKLLSTTTQRTKIMTLLLLVAFLPQMCIDLYLPSMPIMQIIFNTSHSYIQYTLAIYLISSGVAQLLYGPLTDKYGRRPIILWGLLIFFLGSLGCVITQSIEWFLVARFIQGAGGAAITIVYRASVRDLYEGNKLAKIISYANMGWVTIPIIAPVLGSYIQYYTDWHMNFILIFILSAVALLMVWYFYPETQNKANHTIIIEHTMIKKYLAVIKNFSFLLLIFCAMLINVLMLSYNMISPFLLQESLTLTPVEFGWTSVIVAAGYLLGSYINSQTVMRFGQQKMIFLSLGILLIGAISLIVPALLHQFSVSSIIIPISVLFIGAGICYPNVSSSALQCFKNLSGTAGAMLGLVQTGIGALFASIITFLPHNSALPFALFCLLLIGSVIILIGVSRRYEKS